MSDDRLVNAIQKYENHPSVIKIKSFVEKTQLFDFKKTSGAITIKIVKLANKQVDGNLKNCINDCIKQN